MSKQISINTDLLKECNGNLKTLHNEWDKEKRIENNFSVSAGARQAAEECLNEMIGCANEFDCVLENSIDFFQNLGVSFEETDQKAAAAISV